MKRVHGVTLLAVVVLTGTAFANPEALWSLFPQRARITTTGGGLCRLEVPPEVIRTLVEHYTRPGDLVLDGFYNCKTPVLQFFQPLVLLLYV